MSAIVTADEAGDPSAGLRIVTRVNGEIMQDGSTANMLFGIGEILASAKAAARAGHDDAADGAVLGSGVEGRPQLGVHRGREAVERLRSVERQRADAAGVIDANERLCQATVSFPAS